MLDRDRRDPGVELGDLFLRIEDLLAEGNQAKLGLTERVLQHEGVRF